MTMKDSLRGSIFLDLIMLRLKSSYELRPKWLERRDTQGGSQKWEIIQLINEESNIENIQVL